MPREPRLKKMHRNDMKTIIKGRRSTHHRSGGACREEAHV